MEYVKILAKKFRISFAKAGPEHDGKRIFVMADDMSESSKAAVNALREVEGE